MITLAGYLAVAGTVLLFLWAVQRWLLYFPIDRVPTPSEVGLPDAEEVSFETSDGLRLNGWFVAASDPSPSATVLVFNGNAGNRGHRAALASALRRYRLQILLFDYRGYGGNPGAPSEPGLAADSRAAHAYLVGRADVDPARLVYFGESLGTAVAVDLSTDHPPTALVLRSPFTSMVDVGRYHYPFLPIGLLLRDRYLTQDKLHRTRAPLLIIGGSKDRIVPIELTRRVYERALEPKTLLVLNGVDHNDSALLAGNQMIEAIVRFLQTTGVAGV
jgi:fermentation-respiration switch protein FrsA (DUF1100 family)